jgi:hypothetical protein
MFLISFWSAEGGRDMPVLRYIFLLNFFSYNYDYFLLIFFLVQYCGLVAGEGCFPILY